MGKIASLFEHRVTRKVGEWVVVLLVLTWCAVLVARPINLATADLGRHIKNGEIFLKGTSQDAYNVIHTNFYSYTQGDHDFVNHHWGSGVVFYLIFQLAGFKGLSLAYVLLYVLAFGIFFRLAQKASNNWLAVLASLLLMPIIVTRKEVRPEVITYIFTGIFYWILWNYREFLPNLPQAWKGKVIWLLPLLMVFWVNLHIGFVIGFAVLGAFWLEQLIFHFQKKPNRLKAFTLVGLACGIAAAINPAGLSGAIYPFSIFRHYGYLIVENQSIFFLQKLGMNSMGYLVAMVFLVWLSFVCVLVKDKKKLNWPHLFFSLVFAFMAARAIRDYPLFGLFAIPALAYNFSILLPKNLFQVYRKILVGAAFAVTLGVGLRIHQDLNAAGDRFGIGLAKGVTAAADFYKSANIKGPVFNNYDIGGYLIYNLYPQKVFVDNRPEAYEAAFFNQVYIPAQADPKKWAELDAKYNFNTIFFYYHDATPWAQTFLLGKIQDPAWAPVFADSYNIIFLNRNQQNEELIKKYELPKSMFLSVPSN